MRTVCFSDSKKDRLNNHLSPYEYLQMRHRCVSVALHRQDNEKAANQEWRFANMVYPEFSPTASLRAASNERYCEFLDPVILRRSVATQTANASSICNFGKAKGRTYDHVLIYPVADMASWLQDASTGLKPQTRSKLYVAITRARLSAGFVVADNKINELPDTLSVWKP